MAKAIKYYIVAADGLPEIFVKVAEAKRLLSVGEVATVNEATRMTGISRSAFYKYKDSITPFRSVKHQQVVTLSVYMRDTPGALSSVLAIFAENHTNILTINQTIPSNGVALVTFSVTAEGMIVPIDELCTRIESQPAVIRLELLAG